MFRDLCDTSLKSEDLASGYTAIVDPFSQFAHFISFTASTSITRVQWR